MSSSSVQLSELSSVNDARKINPNLFIGLRLNLTLVFTVKITGLIWFWIQINWLSRCFEVIRSARVCGDFTECVQVLNQVDVTMTDLKGILAWTWRDGIIWLCCDDSFVNAGNINVQRSSLQLVVWDWETFHLQSTLNLENVTSHCLPNTEGTREDRPLDGRRMTSAGRTI